MDFELQRQLVPYMKDIVPLPGIYDPDFIAANQDSRANSIIKGTKQEQMDAVREQIREFKASTQVDKLVVLWTANTERYAQVLPLACRDHSTVDLVRARHVVLSSHNAELHMQRDRLWKV